ncbi:type II toxin-antitoxin system HipA family toxin [Azospirillum halopraeferens]|uniref:type II toxin-antitoxin system HipA family toxin n=1 Tax=Azospirillum halopraeferens TaxID=34010 RepID=UPI00042349E0|nr:HipA domain-containing protein [Azospirillum halopraeferens]
MTSETRPAGCYVYITLPGETRPVTAGRYELTTDRRGSALGRFVYGRSYRERPDAVPIDPLDLKLGPRVYETAALNGMFGALRDAGPDYWGRRVIERHAGKAQLGELDYLLCSPDDRAGALGFGLNVTPPAPMRLFNRTLDLAKLQAVADAIVRNEDKADTGDAAQIEELLLVGTSMGGARPKAVVEDEDGLWLAKFNRPDDRWNSARIEHAMLTLGRSCGLTTAESRIVRAGGRDVLLVRRFDREKMADGYRRTRMISGLTLLRTEDTHRARDRWSYVLLVEELRRVTAEPRREAVELFRRMCFNALISNTDDHPRNHAVIARDRDRALSPAYDLTPTSPVSVERRDLAMSCGDAGRFANADNLLSQSARFLIPAEEAASIIDDMEARVKATWYGVARGEGVTEKDCRLIAGAFAYPGFRGVR